jgi:hypothetical protein
LCTARFAGCKSLSSMTFESDSHLQRIEEFAYCQLKAIISAWSGLATTSFLLSKIHFYVQECISSDDPAQSLSSFAKQLHACHGDREETRNSLLFFCDWPSIVTRVMRYLTRRMPASESHFGHLKR